MKKITLILLAMLSFSLQGWSQMSQEEMMAAWSASMTPNENHKFLEKLSGDWDYTMKWYMSAEAEPDVSEGKTISRMIMGGRYLEEQNFGTAMGMPFEGRMIMAYDNNSSLFRSTWIDNLGTGIVHGEGTLKGKTLTFTNQAIGLDGNTESSKMTITLKSETEHEVKMFMTGPDAKEFTSMEIFAKKRPG